MNDEETIFYGGAGGGEKESADLDTELEAMGDEETDVEDSIVILLMDYEYFRHAFPTVSPVDFGAVVVKLKSLFGVPISVISADYDTMQEYMDEAIVDMFGSEPLLNDIDLQVDALRDNEAAETADWIKLCNRVIETLATPELKAAATLYIAYQWFVAESESYGVPANGASN